MNLTVHHQPDLKADTSLPDPHQATYSRNVFGFWLYLMSDTLIFATLFTTYAVLHTGTFGGPSPRDLFQLSTAFSETMLLLLSSVTCGLAVLASLKQKTSQVIFWLLTTCVLGFSFLGLEIHEFYELVQNGHDWKKSAFLSSFFTLVGTHGLHISVGLLWVVVMIAQLSWKGITAITFRRLVMFSMFWHFLDLIWIFIFTLIYLLGVI